MTDSVPDAVEAAGGLTYRLQIPRPDYADSEKRVSDLAELLLDVRDMGRKRNPKKARLREVMTEWNEADAYIALRALLGKRFAHPAINMSVENNAVYDALGELYGDGTREAGRRFKAEHGSTTDGLRIEAPEPDTDTELRNPTLGELWGDWMYSLALEPRSTVQTEMLVEYLGQMAQPWVLCQTVFNAFTLYTGGKMIVNAITDVYDVDDYYRAWRTTGDVPGFFLEARRGTTNPNLEPHDNHHTMKAESTSAESVADDLDHDEWLAQTKYDGARLFVHHSGDGDIRAYTSGNRDVTAAIPELDDIDWPDHSFIFDCEATPYDADGNVVPFENIMTRLTREPGDGKTIDADAFDTDVVLKFFDCPYWRDEDITRRPFEDRFQIVKAVFPFENIARTGEDLEAAFHASIDDGHEGLVIKERDGNYIPGGRHSTWRKWKAEPETIDAVVIGIQQGGGRLADRMGALRLGLRHEGELTSVGYVGTGFTDGERLEFWRDHETDDLDGQVIEVAFEDFQQTGDGWGLRFPSFKRRRPDGEPDTVERAARLQGKEDAFREWAGPQEPDGEPDDDDEDESLGELFG